MRRIEVATPSASYPILIGAGLLSQANVWSEYLAGHEVLVVTNGSIAPLYLHACCQALSQSHCQTLIIEDGEAHKNLHTLSLILDALMQHHFSRKVTLIALGGGVIGDMTGFAAACYQRGVAFIQLPTTLLAQVDSSVGGKTGINHPLGKNMIGAFYQPRAVVIDLDTLYTLPAREYAAGLAEVLKYGLIYDAPFFEWLEYNRAAILAKDFAVLAQMIARCCEIKAAVVAADERELTGLRAILNFGHTVGHAIEAVCGYGEILHGEAVAIGMIQALRLSVRQQLLDDDIIARTQRWLSAVGLPTELPKVEVEALYAAMQHDKKKEANILKWVLLDRLGHAIVRPVEASEVQRLLQE